MLITRDEKVSRIMKNYKGHFIIAGAIVIASAIISLTIYMQNTSSLDHCYKKVYKQNLEFFNKRGIGSIAYREGRAANEARYDCLPK